MQADLDRVRDWGSHRRACRWRTSRQEHAHGRGRRWLGTVAADCRIGSPARRCPGRDGIGRARLRPPIWWNPARCCKTTWPARNWSLLPPLGPPSRSWPAPWQAARSSHRSAPRRQCSPQRRALSCWPRPRRWSWAFEAPSPLTALAGVGAAVTCHHRAQRLAGVVWPARNDVRPVSWPPARREHERGR
jgi:hypothetical protein